jgi:magnesium-transporting ATPase (P-type)
MFAVVLMVAAGITFVAYALTTPRSSANLVLAIGILGVVLLNAVIGFVQEHVAERTAEALRPGSSPAPTTSSSTTPGGSTRWSRRRHHSHR